MVAARRIFVMGDPQAPMAKVMAVLAQHGALDGDRLAEDVVLVSIGDHFDYDLDDPMGAGAEGLRTLRWLASHDAAQVRLLLGNHDASRVIELITLDDARFAAARALARSIGDTYHRDGAEAANRRVRDEFAPRFPDVPTPGLAARDYASYSEEQRDLVIDLLLAGRFHLALSGALPDGRAVLLTHAGVTTRELRLLGLPDERDPHTLAAALDQHLRAAVDARRTDWQRRLHTPMSLAPLHLGGAGGVEGAGMLYHRPAIKDRPGHDPAWELDPARPRRFEPRALPAGLLQVAGHTGHHKCKSDLGEAMMTLAARARAHGGIRTLRVEGDAVVYDLGLLDARAEATDLVLIDGEMRVVAAADYRLLALSELVVPG
jgi:hypothetical protein